LFLNRFTLATVRAAFILFAKHIRGCIFGESPAGTNEIFIHYAHGKLIAALSRYSDERGFDKFW